MRYYKTRGIVLKSYNLGEADKVLHILTDSEGKVEAVAKGLRKPTSKWGGRLEPFTYLNLVLYKGKNLDTITQAEIITSFQKIREDLDKLTYGSAMLELVDVISVKEKDVELFYLLLTALEVLSSASSSDLKLLLAAFDIKAMALAGYTPNFSFCASCRSFSFKRKFFSLEWGGVVCEKCAETQPVLITLSTDVFDLLENFLDLDFQEITKISVSDKIKNEALDFAQRYVNYFIESRLKSREYITKVDVN